MNIKNRRFLAILALLLLVMMFFGVTMHELTSHALHTVAENNIFCAMCILGEHAFKALVPIIIGVALAAICLKAVTKTEKAVIISKTRNFPLLC